MNKLNEIVSLISNSIKPKNLMVKEENNILFIKCNNTTTLINNWKNVSINEIIETVRGNTLNEGFTGNELLLG